MSMKNFFLWLVISIVFIGIPISTPLYAQVNSNGSKIEIIPEVDSNKIGAAHDRISEGDNESVRNKYNDEAKKLTPEEQFVSGIMTRDTLMNYAAIFLKWLAPAGIVMGWVMFIVVWYQYIMSVITGKEMVKKSLITNAIIGILVIIFSYAIMRILTRVFLV